jgi:sarcosine oxidase subunit alpha
MFKRLENIERGTSFEIQVDGESIAAFQGETLASVLLAAGKLAMRKTLKSQSPRGYYCGMGICNECLIELEDGTKIRACQTLAEPGMKINISK